MFEPEQENNNGGGGGAADLVLPELWSVICLDWRPTAAHQSLGRMSFPSSLPFSPARLRALARSVCKSFPETHKIPPPPSFPDCLGEPLCRRGCGLCCLTRRRADQIVRPSGVGRTARKHSHVLRPTNGADSEVIHQTLMRPQWFLMAAFFVSPPLSRYPHAYVHMAAPASFLSDEGRMRRLVAHQI
jgi:hypothetical protein